MLRNLLVISWRAGQLVGPEENIHLKDRTASTNEQLASCLVYIFMDKVPVVADLNFLDNTFQDTCTQTP